LKVPVDVMLPEVTPLEADLSLKLLKGWSYLSCF
jgi:hypothetical protein